MTKQTVQEIQEGLLAAWDTHVEDRHVGKKPAGKGAAKIEVKFIPHFYTKCYLDLLAPGWSWEIVSLTINSGRLYLVGALTVVGSDGSSVRHATGNEELDCSGYGDPSSNAEAMAFGRAAMCHGFARQLWIEKADVHRPGSERAEAKQEVTESKQEIDQAFEKGKAESKQVQLLGQARKLFARLPAWARDGLVERGRTPDAAAEKGEQALVNMTSFCNDVLTGKLQPKPLAQAGTKRRSSQREVV